MSPIVIKHKLIKAIATSNFKLILLIFILSALGFNHAFTFHLFFDDWIQIMGALHYPEVILRYARVHPGVALEFKILAPFFEYNPYPWQLIGFLLKVIGALSMWPLMYALTSSTRAAVYSALIFSVFGVGIETYVWPSGSASAIITPLINIGFYFWITSCKDRFDKRFFTGLVLFAFSILIEPGRAFIVILLSSIWELLSLYQRINLKVAGVSFSKIILVFLLAPIAALAISVFLGINPRSSDVISQLIALPNYNLIDPFKNLLFGWTLLPDKLRELLTFIFFVSSILFLFLFAVKKQNLYKNMIFLYVWIFSFCLVNYLVLPGSKLVSGPTEGRYYALSAIGVVGLLAYGFSFIKTKYVNVLLFLFLVFNLFVTNNFLLHESTYRSVEIFEKIWAKIDQDVPAGETDSIFMFTGTDFSKRAAILDWSDTIPFSAKRKIILREKQPFFTNDKNLIARLICEKEIKVLTPVSNEKQIDQLSLSHVHAWELKGNELENRSDQERDSIKRIAKCLFDKKE